MNGKLWMLLVAFTGTYGIVNAKVWRVNNNPGTSADFIQLTTAVASSSVVAGDTLYVEGGSAAYTGINLSKRLVIIGAGYFLSENAGLQYNGQDAVTNNIIIDSNASGSVIMGIRAGQFFVNTNSDRLTISRCHGNILVNSSFAGAKMADWVVTKCYLGQFFFSSGTYSFENLQFTNNIVTTSFNIGSSINGLVRNNTFTNVTATINNCYVSNNIFASAQALTFINCTVKYNITQGNGLPAGNNNQNGIAQADVFSLTGSTDGRWQLKNGSVATGAGEPINGITPDAGAYGTADPYRLSGIPPIPTVYALSVPASVPSSATTMNVTISTRSNN